MIPKGLFTQIIMVVISVAIIITYIKPGLSEATSTQDDIVVYQKGTESVSEVNDQLATLVSRLEGVSVEDQRRLLTYMPDKIDHISVLRDLLLISIESGATYKNSSYSEGGKTRDANSPAVNMPAKNVFSLQVDGTYDQLKKLLGLMEKNDYPLEITDLNISSIEGGLMSADISLNIYSYQRPENVDNKVIF